MSTMSTTEREATPGEATPWYRDSNEVVARVRKAQTVSAVREILAAAPQIRARFQEAEDEQKRLAEELRACSPEPRVLASTNVALQPFVISAEDLERLKHRLALAELEVAYRGIAVDALSLLKARHDAVKASDACRSIQAELDAAVAAVQPRLDAAVEVAQEASKKVDRIERDIGASRRHISERLRELRIAEMGPVPVVIVEAKKDYYSGSDRARAGGETCYECQRKFQPAVATTELTVWLMVNGKAVCGATATGYDATAVARQRAAVEKIRKYGYA